MSPTDGVLFRPSLIDRTYDINGEYAKKVDEYMRVDEVFPLWGIIDAECERLKPLEVENRKLPFKQQNHEIGRMLYVLPQVGLKLKLYEVSSTYSAIPPSRR